jgi:hypothetical protein
METMLRSPNWYVLLKSTAATIREAPIKLIINVINVKVRLIPACFAFLYSILKSGIMASRDKNRASPLTRKMDLVEEGTVSKNNKRSYIIFYHEGTNLF